jgi:rhodanese-related sulfurtransferase
MQFFIDNAFLIAIAFVSGAMLMWPFFRSRASGPALTTLQVTQLINQKGAQVIDVRDATEFAKGSLPGAKNFPAATAAERASELKKDKPVVVIDAGGAQAGRIAAQLRASGFAEVFVLAGGLAAWREAGLPLRA